MRDLGESMRRMADEANRCRDSHDRMGRAASGAARAFSGLMHAAAEGDAADIAAHPDLTYLDLQARGFYD
ncbi:hypothetical protein [Microbispora rosea]|uniref:hypothetical protein n=1 Tax=Microbispora rosea TaxID=58117 RepID=UPI0012DD1FEF|nr:hypothetical protein [Microbispora rosea]